jgi:uncharacterized membrane protein
MFSTGHLISRWTGALFRTLSGMLHPAPALLFAARFWIAMLSLVTMALGVSAGLFTQRLRFLDIATGVALIGAAEE